MRLFMLMLIFKSFIFTPLIEILSSIGSAFSPKNANLPLIFTLIHKSYLQNKQKQNIYLKASIVSLLVLLVLMMFTNFINTFMFWLFIGINLSILQYSQGFNYK